MRISTLRGAAVAALLFVPATAFAVEDATDALPNAKPGECYAKVMVPAQFKNELQTVVVREAAEKVEIVPAKYETVEERILVREASTKLEAVPAVYDTVTETVELRPARVGWVSGSLASDVEVNPGILQAAANGGVNLASAPAGECYHEHFQAAKYETQVEKVLVAEASARVKAIPARYEFASEQIQTKAASKRLVEVPATYETVTEKVLVEPAKTVWKKGRGPVERLDNSTGEIMCLVEVPAVYKTVTKRVIKTPATTRTIEVPATFDTVKVRKLVEDAKEVREEIPAKYREVKKQVKVSDAKHVWHEIHTGGNHGPRTGNVICKRSFPAATKTIARRVIKTPATTRKIEIPAKYETRRVRKLVADAREVRSKIPEQTRQVSKRVLTTSERLEWRPVLCETNMSGELVAQVQQALKKAGHDPGPIDGVIGRGTLAAVDDYQRTKGLATGGLTMQTLKELGVQL